MWEFDEAVEVRSGVMNGVETPEQFLWRGRLWRVCSVHAYWTETAAWWERGTIGHPTPAATVAYAASSAAAPATASATLAPAGAPGPAVGRADASVPDRVGAAVGVLDAEWGPQRAVYRVEAGCGRDGRRELFDLAHDPDSGRWQLERVTNR